MNADTESGPVALPNREQLLQKLEERQKDLEQEIADIHDLLERLRNEGVTPATEPAPAI